MRFRLKQFRRLLSLPFGDIVRFAAKRVAGLFRSQPSSEFTRYTKDEKLAPVEDMRQQAYAGAAKLYVAQMQPFVGNVELIVSGRRLANNPLQPPDCGWSSHLTTLKFHQLDADHLDLVEEPTVAQVAKIFLESLRQSEVQAHKREAATRRRA